MDRTRGASHPGSPPIAADEFAAALDGLGPFEPAPRLALGVSGGADSIALALLAQAWAAARGGDVLALLVDHGMRAESGAEAALVGDRLACLGIAHRVLAWQPEAGRSNLQARARNARLALLEAACRGEGILHLLLAHHRDDLAETVMLRLARGSGPAGLAGIPALREGRHARILRPLLGFPKSRLHATAAAAGVAWVDDPSNADRRHARVRMRGVMPTLAAEGLTFARLATTAAALAGARAVAEAALSALLARAVAVSPLGHAWIDADLLGAAPMPVRCDALAAVTTMLGGGAYRPRQARLEGLGAALPAGTSGRTLGGCRILRRGMRLLVLRERAATAPMHVTETGPITWDRRFRLHAPAGATIRALGPDGRAALRRVEGGEVSIRREMPAAVLEALPSFWDGEGLLAVPHLGYGRAGEALASVPWRSVSFRPPRPLAPASFMLG